MFLKKIKVTHKEEVMFDLNISLKLDKNSDILTSIIIGENGAGKSLLLGIISEIFIAVKTESFSKLKYEEYRMEYEIHGTDYNIIIFRGKLLCFKNHIKIKNEDLELPENLLAISYTLEDKFKARSIVKNTEESFYIYGGNRIRNALYIGRAEKLLSLQIVENLYKNDFRNHLFEILNFIGYKKCIDISYEINLNIPRTNIYSGRKEEREKFRKLPFENKLQIVLEYKKNYNKSREISNSAFFENNIQNLTKQILKKLENDEVDKYEKTSKKTYRFSVNKDLTDESKYIFEEMEKLGILGSVKIHLQKNSDIDFSDMSSGEKQIFSTFVKIAANIKKNSLILLDEPELSLHPRWQQQYISVLKNIFKNYSTSHMIIATHSHFIISDLNPNSSTISFMKIIVDEKYKRILEEIPFSTFGWSAENILYNVFELRTSRNKYFNAEVERLLYYIDAEHKNTVQIQELYNKLKSFVLSPDDPLNQVMVEVKDYLNEHN